MTSILKVDQLQDSGGNAIITSDGSGNLTTQKLLYPAFEAHLNTATTFADATVTKVQCDIEEFDTDNCYDNTTNYRFTPTIAGKYFVYAYARINGTVSNSILNLISYIYKNGSVHKQNRYNFNSGATENIFTVSIYTTLELNGSSDYIEFFGYGDTTSGSPTFHQNDTLFGAYRIGD
jgi:hypothetical protein